MLLYVQLTDKYVVKPTVLNARQLINLLVSLIRSSFHPTCLLSNYFSLYVFVFRFVISSTLIFDVGTVSAGYIHVASYLF